MADPTAEEIEAARALVAAADAAFADIRRALDSDSLDGILLACKVNPIFKRNK